MDARLYSDQLFHLLQSKKSFLGTAESCTGGLIAKLITDRPSSSDVFWGSVVCYSNDSKITILQVSESNLIEFGAVSQEVCTQMSKGLLAQMTSSQKYCDRVCIALSTTGIAGPDGGTPSKPVGTCWIGVSIRYPSGDQRHESELVTPHSEDASWNPSFYPSLYASRQAIRERFVTSALLLLEKLL